MKKETYSFLLASALTAVVLSGTALFLTQKKQAFSENENRYLEQFPDFSWEKLEDGSFTKGLESWFSDHFPFRDSYMSLKANMDKISGKREINGIYLGKDGYLLEKYKEPKNSARIIKSFNGLTEAVKQAEVAVMLVPTSVTIYENKLPPFADVGKQKEWIASYYESFSCKTIDITHRLLDGRDVHPLYYRLDHHWTTYGAYIGYQAYCEAMGFEAISLEMMEKEEVTQDFKGTLYSKVNDYSLSGDTITAFFVPDQKLSVYYPDTDLRTDSLYEYSYLKKKDKYSFFLNNLHPMVEITNENMDGKEELVIIKDSYANSVVPFLTQHYKKIYVIDPRYYRESISEFINEREEVKDVLILYNLGTIDSDLGIGGIY